MYHNDALKTDIPSEVKRIIQIHFKEEENHLACIAKMKKQA